MQWSRITTFSPQKSQQEIWLCDDPQYQRRFNVDVTTGKDIDILSLKANLTEGFSEKVQRVKESREAVYRDPNNLERVKMCPVCSHSSEDAQKGLNIYGAQYVICSNCSHYFVLDRPTEGQAKNFYSQSVEYQSTYADKRSLETRVNQVAIPKAKYVIEQYERQYGRKPKSILDVGAGSGHFVYACRKLGVDCQGVEISEPGRVFAKENFGVELLDVDFLKGADQFNCDVVTFFGLIEHVTSPVGMLKAAKQALGSEGMVIADVPRWNCVSTAVHASFPQSVVRHLDPMDHIQCFSDSSLATAFVFAGYDVVAAWYFGMDAFELVMQVAHASGDPKIVEALKEKIPILQESFDSGRLSDFMVFAGIPTT
ncbi:MAG: methyltransferase domain-containing protein [bacterium]|nr:methyltransferase domain-containing protein [bacterium]